MTRFQKYGLMIILFFATNLFVLAYLNYRTIETKQMFISNRLYSTWNMVLVDQDLEVEDISSIMPPNSRIFFEHDETGNMRSFYQNSQWQPPLIEGAFFEQYETLPQAVVGIQVKNNLNLESSIIIGKIEYKIIGIIGASYPSPLDHLILLNNKDHELGVERIVLDNKTPTNMEVIYEHFETRLDNENQSLSRFLNSDLFTQLIELNVAIITVILVFIAGYLHHHLFKKVNNVKYMLGVTKLNIFRENLLTLIILFGLSYLGIFIIDRGVRLQILTTNNHYYLLKMFAIIFIFSLVFYFENLKNRRAG